ncbi:MAG: bestrophin family ion channel [Cyclobacteriaceae bacterium]
MIIAKRLPIRIVLQKSLPSILAVTIYASLVYSLTLYLDIPNISISIPAFMGTSITLLLSFKLNQSYDRWWEGRKIWGAIVNDSRSLVVQARQFIKDSPASSELIKKIAYRQIGWCHVLARALRRLDQKTILGEYISADEKHVIDQQTNLPLALLDQHGNDIRKLHEDHLINDYQQVQLDQTIVRLTTSMGQAERIKNTVFPPAYAYMINVFMYLFLALFALSVAETIGIWQVVLSTLISIPFILLMRTAYVLQDPFENEPSDTPMTAISNTIERNLKELLGEVVEDQNTTANKYYIM